jgi:hypothetical protein
MLLDFLAVWGQFTITPHIGNKHANRSVTIVVNMLSRAGIVAAFAVVMMAPSWAQAEDFIWKDGGVRVGRLKVPAGFKVENYNYREGIVTTLLYRDGSRVTLQSGGMYRLPLFQGAEYVLISSTDQDAKTVRLGRSANGKTCWREDNYRPKKATEKRISMRALFPPNVGYSNVSDVRRSDFDRALDSFVREMDRIPVTDR